ncbi:hypothetical protein ACIBH1_43855 [Nonomuraea sp. NPDC050663]|uniref:hypothetical protein n=1 Tax=Nonomuraea sp. NPDC050663 TaxID=3364370 RepID=UPI00379ADEB9
MTAQNPGGQGGDHIVQYGTGNIGKAEISGVGDIIAGGGGGYSSGIPAQPPAPRSAARKRGKAAALAAAGAVLSAVIGGLVNVLTTSWSWWLFAAASGLLAVGTVIAFASEFARSD